MTKLPKKANHAIGLLEELVELLHYFYKDHPDFRKDVLNPAREIEDILKDLAINKKETFKRIAAKYKEYYEKKHEITVGITDDRLNDSVKQRYRSNIKKDRK